MITISMQLVLMDGAMQIYFNCFIRYISIVSTAQKKV